MNKSDYFKKHGYDCFDRHACLKPSIGLVVSVLFLCRSVLLPLLIGLASLKGSAEGMTWVLAGSAHPALTSLLALPALAVLVALVRRSPRTGPWPRLAWAHGRSLLLLSAIAQAGVALDDVTGSVRSVDSDGTLVSICVLALLGVLIGYLLGSTRVRDCFAEFPSPDADPAVRTRSNERA